MFDTALQMPLHVLRKSLYTKYSVIAHNQEELQNNPVFLLHIIDVFIAHTMGYVDAHMVHLYYATCVRPVDAETIEAYLVRYLQGEPVAYILQQQEFYGLSFKVTPSTLIPRPETEELVEHVANFCRDRTCSFKMERAHRTLEVLDIATGSGCIVCSLAHTFPSLGYTALDIDPQTISVASHNAQQLCSTAAIDFVCADLYDLPFKQEIFDCIVANPPYLAESDFQSVAYSVSAFEPYHALVAGKAGIEAACAIIEQSYDLLKQKGKLFLEIGCTHSIPLQERLKKSPFRESMFVCDLSGHVRFLIATKE